MSKNMLCRCEDVPLAEVTEAIVEGYDDLESLRRYTALGTGPCQGKACIAECIRVLARHHQVPEDAVGLHTMRPPITPLPLGLLAVVPDEDVEALMAGPGIGHGHLDDTSPHEATHDEETAGRPPRGIVSDATFDEWRASRDQGGAGGASA